MLNNGRSIRFLVPVIWLFSFVGFQCGQPLAATLEVDSQGGAPYTTIQSAIAAATPGVDDIFVHCGLYEERVEMRDQVSVRGEASRCTVIDGGANGPTVTMIGIGAQTILEGFTIRNGRAALGGGIYIEAGSPIVRANRIVENEAVIAGPYSGFGGGIFASAPPGDYLSTTAPTISGNVIRDNRAETSGGGIDVEDDDGAIIRNNLIIYNTATNSGGGIEIYQAFPTITNNTILWNCLQGGETACSFGGGGISTTNSGVVNIYDNLVVWNEAVSGGGGIDLVGSTTEIHHNNCFENLPENYSGIRDPTGSNGNISLDPLLVSYQDSEFHAFQPRSDSPLVDAADGSYGADADMRGIPRPLDGDADGTTTSDIGARENEGTSRLTFLADGITLSWDPSIDAFALYNIYRGNLQRLQNTGEYIQDSTAVTGARQWCGIGSTSLADSDIPDSAQVHFYLVVIENAVEGLLGFDSVPAERPFTEANRCL